MKRFIAITEDYAVYFTDSQEVADEVSKAYIVYDLQTGIRIDVPEDEPDTIQPMENLE